MPSHPQPYLIAENIGYELDSTKRLFDGIYLSLSAGDRIGLVGSNGIGKSTLLKILANQVKLAQGAVSCHRPIYYLPQINTIRVSIHTKSVLDVLNAHSDEWWEVEHSLETIFQTSLDLSQPINQLSGGELTKLFLAIGLAQSPDLLLLDEPTNHLDQPALEALRQVLCQFQGAFVIVSHKPFFLDQVAHTTWELSPDGLQVYGGNFSHYREQKQLEQAAKLRSHEAARKELNRTKASALQEQERAAQSRRNGRQRQLNGDMPRIIASALRRKAEATAGTLKTKHDKAIAVASQNVNETKVRTHKAASIQLEEKSQKHKTLIDIRQTALWVEHQCLLHAIDLHIMGGDRIVIAGANGAGKSCLIKAILGDCSTPTYLKGGEIQIADLQTVYLDQAYALVDRTQTVLENLQRTNPGLSYQLLRQQLGHFLFFNDEVHKPASVLSGGELARLAIAMITITELDLLILDEPTNNLDIETVDQMVDALNKYQGALWVISHDLDFLSRINLTHAFKLTQKTLKPMNHLPTELSRYHTELLT